MLPGLGSVGRVKGTMPPGNGRQGEQCQLGKAPEVDSVVEQVR